jgi:RNA polymerase sigma factor (sigma-70 family)
VTWDAEAPDSALACLAAAGDHRAFGALVTRHKDALYRLLRRYLGDSEEAYEAVHEAFIAAWGALKRYDPQRPFDAWLRTIAINKARDRGRRRAIRRLIFGDRGLDDEALAIPDPALSSQESLVHDQQAQQLDVAIRALPAPLKEALLLTAFEGYSQQEAGQILGVSVKTIETRAHRARKLLAERLDTDLRPSGDERR